MTFAVAAQREEIQASLAAGDLRKALELSGRLLEADPADTDAIQLRAAALMSSGDHAAATALLLEPAKRPDAPHRLRATLAMCQRAAGDFDSAARTFSDVLAERPDDFALRLSYAECLDMQADAEGAVAEYLRSVRTAQGQGRWLSDASTAPALRDRVKRAMDVIDGGRLALFERVLAPHVAALGRNSLARITEALEIYLELRPAPQGNPMQRPKFLQVPSLPDTPFFDRALFPWYEALESSTAAIRDELVRLLDSEQVLTPFLELADSTVENEYLGGDARSRAWDASFFYRHGERFADQHAASPLTSAALSRVPLTEVAGHAPEVLFSVLAPQSHIKPHHGVTNTRVVTHLPLIIPAGDCKLVVGGIEHAWQEGRCVTFDDTFLHEAWNRTDARRVVLILDTWNPYLTPEECLALKDLVEAIGHFNVRAGMA